MSDAETRSLGRVAVLLLAAGVLRLALASREEAAPRAGPDVLPGLLAESRARSEEEALRSSPLGSGERLDPNRASAAELDRLPGVGPSIAEAIVRSRDAEGPYRALQDLLRVRGVGPALLARVGPHLALPAGAAPAPGARPGDRPAAARGVARGEPAPARPDPPLDLNRADTLALLALPGVGPALARRIVEARAASPFRSVDDLLKVRGIGPATLARLRPLVAVAR
jgi:competence protein ComEA